MDGAAVALVIAVVIFVTVRRAAEWTKYRPIGGGTPSRSPSPRWGVRVWAWLRAHTRRDPDPDPEPDPPILTQEHEWGAIDYTESQGRRQVVREKRPTAARLVVPPAKPTPARKPGPPPPTALDNWVSESLRKGARYADVLREGRRLFGVSEATVKRSIRRARKEPPK